MLAFQLFFGEVGLQQCPGLCRWGFVLPGEHLLLGEHLAVPHLGSRHHRLLVVACRDSTVAQRDLKTVEQGEVGRDARSRVPRCVVAGDLLLVLLRHCHLDGRFLAEVVQHREDRGVSEADVLLLEWG